MKTYPLVPTLVLTALAAGSLWQSALAEEPPRRAPAGPPVMIPFEAYAKHGKAIGLSEDQMKELGRVAEGMGDSARKLEGERRQRTEALQEVLAQRPIDLEKAVERFQAVLKAEDEMKALQFRSGLTVQNMLSPDQVEKVRAIAAKVQGSREGGPGGIDPGALLGKLDQLRGELRKRSGGELSKENVQTLERIEQAAQQGKLDEARKQMEGLLAQLGGKENERQPSPSELKDAADKTKAKIAETSDPERREKLEQQLAKIQAMQDRQAANSEPIRREKNAQKSEGDSKDKGGKQPEKPFVKVDGESKEKGGKPPEKPFTKVDGGTKNTGGGQLEKPSAQLGGETKDKGTPKADGEHKVKSPLKGEGEVNDKGKFDRNTEAPKHADPELRKRVESALAEFQEAKAAGNRERMEKITKSIESLLRDSARESGGMKEGARKDSEPKDGSHFGAANKEGSVKEGARKEGGPKDGVNKDGAVKDGAFRKDGRGKEVGLKDGDHKETANQEGARRESGSKDGDGRDGAPKE